MQMASISEIDLESDVQTFLKEGIGISADLTLLDNVNVIPGHVLPFYEQQLPIYRLLTFAQSLVQPSYRPFPIDDSVSSQLATVSLDGNCAEWSESDAEMKQLRKDIERDTILINGTLLHGSTVHLEGVGDHLVNVCSALTDRFGSFQLPRRLANHVLGVSSRTVLGSAIFHAVHQYTVGAHPHSLLVPLSTHSAPIEMTVRLAVVEENKWGLMFSLRCNMIYVVQNQQMDDSDVTIPSSSNVGLTLHACLEQEFFCSRVLSASAELLQLENRSGAVVRLFSQA